jgi:predicted nucleic acid-binding protein
MSAPSRPQAAPRILADTTIWIRAFRAKSREDISVKEKLQHGLKSRQIYTCWVIKTELLAGARDEQDYEDWLLRLGVIPEIELTPSVWRQAARLCFLLRRKGYLMPLPDILIAAAALEGGCSLWCLDTDFERIAAVSKLRIE